MFIVSGSGNKKTLFERVKAEDGLIVCADPIELRETAYNYYGITGLNIISYNEFYTCKIDKYDKPIYINDINNFIQYRFPEVKGYSLCFD